MARFAVLGAGSWGTALAIHLAGPQKHDVTLWEFRPDAAENLAKDRENKEFLAGIQFPARISITNDLDAAIEGVDAVLLVVPSQFVRMTLEKMKNPPDSAIWIGASKGIENGTLLRQDEVIGDVLGQNFRNRFVALSGPSHAEEVSRNVPTSVVAACQNLDYAQQVQDWFSGASFRVYASYDIVGVELGGSLKNVVAIATGILDGLGFGDNTRGALMTRGLAEMSRLGTRLGGQRETFAGLSGMGDLITTCVSKHSRNRHVGEQIGKGKTLQQVLDEMTMVAEGVATTRSARDLARKFNVEMPITEQVYSILFDNASPAEAVRELMTRSLKVEIA